MGKGSASTLQEQLEAAEQQLATAHTHVQELQELLADEQASQREWRTYAESKTVEALAALEAMEKLKQEQVIMEDYISCLEAENASLKSCVDELQQHSQEQAADQLTTSDTTTSSILTTPPYSPPVSALALPATSSCPGPDWRRLRSPTSPAYVPAALHSSEVSRLEAHISSLQELLQQSQDNEAFLRQQLAKLPPPGGSMALATLNCGSDQLRQRVLEIQAVVESGLASTETVQAEGEVAAKISPVDLQQLKEGLWQYAEALEEEKVVLAREMEEFQTSWLAAEERCSALQGELDELRVALGEAAAKEELLQKECRRMERIASGQLPAAFSISTPESPPAPPELPYSPMAPSPSGGVCLSLSPQLDAVAMDKWDQYILHNSRTTSRSDATPSSPFARPRDHAPLVRTQSDLEGASDVKSHPVRESISPRASKLLSGGDYDSRLPSTPDLLAEPSTP